MQLLGKGVCVSLGRSYNCCILQFPLLLIGRINQTTSMVLISGTIIQKPEGYYFYHYFGQYYRFKNEYLHQNAFLYLHVVK